MKTDKNSMEYDVVGLGTIVVDHQVVLAEYPQADTKNAALADNLQVGGPVPTGLALLSRLGRECAFFGRWGDDVWGQFIEDDLQREGIHFNGDCRREESRTGFAQVWIDEPTGERTIAYRRTDKSPAADEIDVSVLSRCRALYLDGWPEGAALRAAGIVKESGGLIFLDTGSLKPGMRKLIPMVDVLNCPRRFLQEYFGADDIEYAGRKLVDQGPRLVTVTDGQWEATAYTAEEKIHQSAFRVEAVDTCGAGDVFSGALLHAVLEDRSPREAVRFAAAAAALKCRGLGNRDALPSLEAIEELVEGQ